jgi:hypothetical protein
VVHYCLLQVLERFWRHLPQGSFQLLEALTFAFALLALSLRLVHAVRPQVQNGRPFLLLASTDKYWSVPPYLGNWRIFQNKTHIGNYNLLRGLWWEYKIPTLYSGALAFPGS